MLSRLLYLEPNQLRRASPFFALYLILFTGLTLADGLSLTLFLTNVPTDLLPRYYAISSLCVLVAVVSYMLRADRHSGSHVFQLILIVPVVLFAGIWGVIHLGQLSSNWLGCLFIGRELAFALVLLHFGSYLQDYFTRSELDRVMPTIYAGGRVGGIAGGALLEHVGGAMEPIHLLWGVTGLLGVGMVAVAVIGRRITAVAEEEVPPTTTFNSPSAPLQESAPADSAPLTIPAFLRMVWTNRLLFWISVTTVLYFGCRTFLYFRCGEFFATAFATDQELARFLGRYTQWALFGSLVLQLLVINRWIAWAGLRGAHLSYASLLVGATLLASGQLTLGTAILARLVEGELRYSLRNPVSQLIVNRFPRRIRIRARAWSLGLLIPISTFAASATLGLLVRNELGYLVAGLTAALGIGYLVASFPLLASLNQTPSQPPHPRIPAPHHGVPRHPKVPPPHIPLRKQQTGSKRG